MNMVLVEHAGEGCIAKAGRRQIVIDVRMDTIMVGKEDERKKYKPVNEDSLDINAAMYLTRDSVKC